MTTYSSLDISEKNEINLSQRRRGPIVLFRDLLVFLEQRLRVVLNVCDKLLFGDFFSAEMLVL